MIHIAIYNETLHAVEFEETYLEDELTDFGQPAGDHNAWRLEQECIGRGTLNGTWLVYNGDKPFSWPEPQGEADKADYEVVNDPLAIGGNT